MKGKKSLSVLLAAAMTAGMLTGAAVPVMAEEGPEVEISLMSWHAEGGDTKYYDGLKYAMDAYTELHPNVTFKYVMQPYDGYMDLLDTQYISKTAPDLVYMQPHMNRMFADKGVLLPLDEYMYGESAYAEGERWVDTFSGGEDSFSKSKASNSLGAIMFVPMDGAPELNIGQPFYYNKDLFAKAGITELPRTWVEFIDALQKLQDSGVVPVAAEGIYRHISWSFGWIAEQFGEHYMDQYFDAKFNGSDKGDLKEDKRAIALANDWFKADDQIFQDISNCVAEYAKFFQDGWTGASQTEQKNLFLMQEAAIIQDGSWAYGDYDKLITDFEWGILPIPLITKETSEYAIEGFMKPSGQQDSGLAVSGTVGEDPDKCAAVVDFLQFLTSKDVQQEYTKVAISLSPVKGVTQPEELQAFAFDTSLCIYEDAVGASYMDFGDSGIWGGLCQDYLTGANPDTIAFNQQVIENSKQTAVNTCYDRLTTLIPESIAEVEAKVEQLKADGASEDVIAAQEASLEMLKLKLEMYETYCSDL